ncbi:uncharacterized protein LOC111883864 [Lactuca sativa]|uniref:uncharacterized protein LOC111883864 n=1 Tax=Lactuca sativa TaxID=4236 RepID=UPI000CD8D582|nr:uncharacterized protein LOC111883864 [Lactuca sativa]
MEAGLGSRKRKHQSLKSGGIFTRSNSQIYVRRRRSGYARSNSVRTINPIMSLEATTNSPMDQDPWGSTAHPITSEVLVKDLRVRRIFSPMTVPEEDSSVGAVDLKADFDVRKTNDGNPNVSSSEGDPGHCDLGVSSSVVIDPKHRLQNIVDSFLVSENNVMEADEFLLTPPRVSDSDQNNVAAENNGFISIPNEVGQSSLTSSRSKKKVFINRGSYNSYRRLLPYLTDIGTDDSPSFEIVEATMTKQQKSSTIVPNMVASKDKDVDAVPNLNNLADCAFKSQEDAVIDKLDECEQTTPPDSVSVSKMVLKQSSRMKMLQTPTSFSHRRLLPYLTSVSEPEKTSEENQQDISNSLQSTTVNQKSDSSYPTLTPVKPLFESITTITPVSNDNLLDSNRTDIKSIESTSQLAVKLQAEEQESRNKDLKCIEETSPDINDNQKPVNESTHESLLQIPPLNSPLINRDNSRNGISVANEIIDTQGSMVKIQSMVTNLHSKKKVFISPKSFSYRRLLPYLTEPGTNDSPNFEIVEATLPKVQKSSNMVPNKDHEIDAVPTNSKSGLSDSIQKSHEDALNDSMEKCLQMKMLQTPTSFSHRRLLPFLTSVSGDDSGNIIVDESQTTADEKSDSPTSTLTPIQTSSESTTTVAQVSNDNLVDTHGPDTKLTESTSHSGMKLQAEADSLMKVEQESPIKDLKLVQVTTSDLEIVPSVDTNDNQKAVNGSTHESLLQIAPLNTPLINRDISKNGILKRTPRGCRGICNCLNCTSFRLHAERSFEFSRNQMHDAEEVALELINDMNSLRNILERTGADSNEVKEVFAKALYKEEVARAKLAQMNEDLNNQCRSMGK